MSTLGELDHHEADDASTGPAPDLGAGPSATTHRVTSIVLAVAGIAVVGLLARIVMFPSGVFAGYASEVGMHSSVDGVALIGMTFPDPGEDNTLNVSATARIAAGSAASITEVVVCRNDGTSSGGIGALDQWSDLRRYCASVEPAYHAPLGPYDSLVAVVVPLASGTITVEGIDVTRHRFGRDITEHSGTKATIEVAA